MLSIILILTKLLLWNKLLKLLWHKLLLGLWIEHTLVILVHLLLLHLTRLVIHLHLLLWLCYLTVQNLHALILGHPAIVAVLSEGVIVVEASLAGPVSDFSLLVVTIILSLLVSVVESMVVILELYDSISSGDSDGLTIFLNDVTDLRSFLFKKLFSFLFCDVSIFSYDSHFITHVAWFSLFAVEVLASRAFPSDNWIDFGKRLNREDGTHFWAGVIAAVGRVVSCFGVHVVIKFAEAVVLW